MLPDFPELVFYNKVKTRPVINPNILQYIKKCTSEYSVLGCG